MLGLKSSKILFLKIMQLFDLLKVYIQSCMSLAKTAYKKTVSFEIRKKIKVIK